MQLNLEWAQSSPDEQAQLITALVCFQYHLRTSAATDLQLIIMTNLSQAATVRVDLGLD